MMGAAGVVVPNVGVAECGTEKIVKHDAPPRNRRPYAGLDWQKVQRVKTTSHGHCMDQKFMDAYLERGFGLLTLSNYYPSAPGLPAAKMTKNYYRLHHEHPVMVNGKRVDGPFDWNSIVGPWKGEMSDADAKRWPS